MKSLIRVLVIVGAVVGVGVAAYRPVSGYLEERNRPKFRTGKIERGDITYEVDATGGGTVGEE